jgi:ATP-dependent RNA helicase DeaD
MNDFRSLGLSERTLATLEKKGFKIPTDIQSLAIPLLMENKVDIIAQAQTGTGKTAVFALPLIEKLEPNVKHVQAIILAPTRELAIQVCDEIESLKGDSMIRTVPIYGGQFIEVQLKKLKRGVNIVVGTPGRILDHIRRKTLILDRIEYFILDEADEMLNMGFIEDIEEIMGQTPKQKRVLLFSATMPNRIKKLAENYMGEYTHVRWEPQLTTDLTEQIYFEVRQREKLDALARILEIEQDFYGIIFCKTKADVDELTNKLIEKGLKADNLHGDISQPLREKILGKFRNRKINVLVATDVAARGIDVGDLTHVINYAIPNDPESYVHRIGRTGRAGKKGTAITFVTPSEFRKMKFIKKFTQADIVKQRVPERQEVVDLRKKKVKTDIERMLSQKETEGYREWAKELLEGSGGEDLITALLKYSFGKDLEDAPERDRRKVHDKRITDWKRDERAPPKKDTRPSVPQADIRKTRLIIAMGKNEKMNKGRIVELINRKAGTHPDKITNIEIMDDFTFITVPAKDAKSILKFFRRSLKGKQPLVTKVKEEQMKGPKGKRRSRKEKGRFVRP